MTEQERAAWLDAIAATAWNAGRLWAIGEGLEGATIPRWPPRDHATLDLARCQSSAVDAFMRERKVKPLMEALEQVRAYLVDGDVGEARALIDRVMAKEG